MTNRETSIRRANPSDANALAPLIRSLARHEGHAAELSFSVDQLRAALRGGRPRLRAIVAEDAIGLVEFVSYTVDFAIWSASNFIRIRDIYVRRRARGQGIGRRLMIFLGKVAAHKRLGIRREIRADNSRARHFYESLGAQITTKYVARWSVEKIRLAIAEGAFGLGSFTCRSDFLRQR